MPPVVLRGELYLAMSIPRRIRRHVPNSVAIGRAVRQLPQTFEFVTPKTPGVLRSELYLAYVHSQTNLPTCTKFGANRYSRLTASSDFWICDPYPPPPEMPPGVLRGDLYLAYVHSQINPHTWTKVGANRSSRLTASPECLTPKPPPPSAPPLCLEEQFVWRISIPMWICRCVPNVVPIGPAVWQLPKTFEFLKP